MDSLTYMQLLRRNRSFRRLWTGQVISELGNWFNFIAALGVVRVVSHSAARSHDNLTDRPSDTVHLIRTTCRSVR
jgi:hypothetical protein